jgi:hypothetical protein
VRDEAPYGCTVSLFHLHRHRFRIPRPVAVRRSPLAYSPTKPPARDYFFQYTWILLGVFNPQVNLREHRYFGSPLRDSARFLFDFWANARRGDGPALQRYCQFGFFSENELRTPMAAYQCVQYSSHIVTAPGECAKPRF